MTHLSHLKVGYWIELPWVSGAEYDCIFREMCLIIFHDGKRKAGFAFCPCGNSGCSSCTSETLNAASMQSYAEFLETQFFVLILFIKLSNILAEKINAATSSSFVFSLQQHGTWLVIVLESSTPNRTFISVCRTGRGISCYQLVSGAGDTPGQSPLRLVEPHCRRLPVGFCSAGHLGHLRQGLCPPQGSPRQPARLLPLVRGSALHSSCSLILDTWKFSQAALSSCCIFKNGLVLSA